MPKRQLIALFFTLFLILPALTLAVNTPVQENISSELVSQIMLQDDASRIHMSLEIPTITAQQIAGDNQNYDRFGLKDEALTGKDGWPELPIVSRTILVPPSARIQLRVNNVDSHIENAYTPFIVPEQVGSFDYDFSGKPADEFLQHDGFWPPEAISIAEPAIMRGNRLVTVTMFPLQYNPGTGETRVNTSFDFELVYDNGEAINPVRRPDRVRHSTYTHKILRHLVENPPPEPDRDDLQSGSYLYIVPEVNGVDETLAPLIEWRQRQGHKVVVAHVRNNANSGLISEIIDEAYEDWDNPVEFVALVGDVSGGSINLAAASGFGDYNYARTDGNDPLPDLAIGRISVSSRNELEIVVGKLVGYESDPWMENLDDDDNWFEHGAVVAGNPINGLGTVLVAKYAEQTLYRAGYEEVHGYFHNVDGNIGGNQPFVREQFDWGISAFIYRAYQRMNNYPMNEIANLPNRDGRWPPVIAISCDTGSFINEISRTEGFLRSRGGGVGAVGTATPQTHVQYNNIMAGGTFAAMYKHGLWAFGWGLNMGKFELWRAYQGFDGTYMGFMDWNNLMGDPGTHIWTGTPQIITVEHSETVSLGQSSYIVHVEIEEDESALEYALVCLFKGDELHDVAYTNADGDARFSIPSSAMSEGEMMVTVTKHNTKPYLGSTDVVEHELYLGADDWMLNDEEGGDGDNIANPGESFALSLQLMNFGTGLPEGEVSITAISHSPWAEVSEDAVVIEASPEVGEAVEIEFAVVMGVDSPDESTIMVEFIAANGEMNWSSMVVFEVEAPRLVISQFEYAGDNLERGEAQWVNILVTNVGSRAIDAFSASLSSENDVIRIINGDGQYPSLEPGESSIALGDDPAYQIGAHIFSIPGMQVELQLSSTTEAGFHDQSAVTIQILNAGEGDPFGPDEYGYICFDSNDEGWDLTPTYDWIEIDPEEDDRDFNGTPADISDTADNSDESEVIDLPFVFQYYGEEFDKITICSNGWAAFGDQHSLASFRNRHIGQALGPDAHLAIFWDNLLARRGEIIYYHDEEDGRFIIEWNDVQRLVQGGGGVNETFEIILYDVRIHPTYTGDGIIDYQYKDVTNQNRAARNDTPYATIGIGNLDDSGGLEYTYWNDYAAGASVLEDQLVIRFTNATEYITGILTGRVTSASTGEPIAEAQVSTTRGFWGRTDENGMFNIDDILIGEGYGVTVSKLGFNDSTNVNEGEGFNIVEAETTFVDFALLHPEFNIDVAEFSFQLNADDSLSDGFTLSNDGDGTLIYDSKFIYIVEQEDGENGNGDPNRDEMWDPLLQWSASDSVDDMKLQGIAFINNQWIVSGPGDAERDTSWFYKFDKWGNFTERIQQPILDSRTGLRNLVSYEGFLYGANFDDKSIMKIDPVTFEVVNSFAIPDDVNLPPHNLTIDNEGNFWVASTVNNLFKFELVGDSALVELADFRRRDPINRENYLRNYGIAWFRDDPDGYNLYMVSSDARTDNFAIHKMHPETGDIQFLTTLPGLPQGSRGKGGMTITPRWNNLVWVMAIVVDKSDGDFVHVTELGPNSSWIDYSPRSDTLFAAETVPIEIMIATAELDTGEYAVIIEFSHNAEGAATRVQVELIITTLSAPEDSYLPMEYSLEQNWPNPFNPSTSIRYSLREAGLTTLSIFDIMGREVMQLVNENQPVGRYQLSFDGSAVPAGLYFYRITSGEFTLVRKMLLIK